MALEMSFVCALLFGGLIINVQGNDNMYSDCCIRETLQCMECFPPVPLDDALPETSKTLEDCPIRDQIYKCVEGKLNYCSFFEKGIASKYENCVSTSLSMTFNVNQCARTVIELCTEGTELRERYLNYSECIMQQYQRTNNDEFINSCIPDPEPFHECDIMLKKKTCFLSEVDENCGRDSRLLMQPWRRQFFEDLGNCFDRQMKEMGWAPSPSADTAEGNPADFSAQEQIELVETPTEETSYTENTSFTYFN